MKIFISLGEKIEWPLWMNSVQWQEEKEGRAEQRIEPGLQRQDNHEDRERHFMFQHEQGRYHIDDVQQ